MKKMLYGKVIKIASFAVVILFIAMSGATIATGAIVSANSNSRSHMDNDQIKASEVINLDNYNNTSFVNRITGGNWAGYGFFNMPWYTFGNPETVDWVSEYIHVPNCVQQAPSDQTTVSSCIAGWDALSATNNGNNMWQAGFFANPNNGEVELFSEHFYQNVNYGATFFSYNSNHPPVTLGSNLYIYLAFDGNKFCSVITDLTNHVTYYMNKTFNIETLNPKFFLSVIETPEVNGQITSVPVFSEFQVNSLVYYSGGEHISGENSHSSGSYAKYTLSQYCTSEKQRQANIKISFSSSYSVDGGYDVTYLNSDRNL